MAERTKSSWSLKKGDASERATAAEPAKSLPDAAPHTVSHMLGEIVWLMSQSPAHKHFMLVDLEWMIMPPILLRQFRLFHGGGKPVGAALWAFVSADVELKISNGQKLHPSEWKSGDRCWLIDLIAPSATLENRIVDVIIADLICNTLKNVNVEIPSRLKAMMRSVLADGDKNS